MKQERSGSTTPGIAEPANEGNSAHRLNTKQKLFQLAVKGQQRVITTFERGHFFPKQAKRLSSELGQPQLLLDIGSGKGYLGDALQAAMPDTKIVSTDVGDDHQGKTKFVSASGDALPFGDNTFDTSTIFYVLHHFAHPEDALQEAKRVSKRIIIQEDTYRNRWQKKWYQLHLNSYQLNSPKSVGTTVRTDKEWQEIFDQEGLAITRKRRIRKVGYPVTRYEYQLEPKAVFEATK